PENFLATHFSEDVTSEKRCEIIKQYILEEIPAHLAVNFLWVDDVESEERESKLQEFKKAYESWQKAISNNSNQQVLRATRDRLIDLLGIGKTYPLSDLEVRVKAKDSLVPFKQNGSITIAFSQSDVIYQLYDETGEEKILDENEEPIAVIGTGKGFGEEEMVLTTPPITEEVTYKILACKQDSPDTYKTFLEQTASVKVGLNLDLDVKIISEMNKEDDMSKPVFLAGTDSSVLIHFEHRVMVQIDDAQEGVKYRLKDSEGSLLSAEEGVTGLGIGKSIEIKSNPIQDDTDIHIEAVLSRSDNEADNETEILKRILPLRVRAKTELEIRDNTILAFGTPPSIEIQDTQNNVLYQAFRHQLRDDEFIFGTGTEKMLAVPVPKYHATEYPAVHVASPAWKTIWKEVPAGYVEIGREEQGHDDAVLKLEFPKDSLTEDSLIILRAAKEHKKTALAEESTETVRSEVQLRQAVMLLVEPDPVRPLSLKLHVKDEKAHSLEIASGQTGVFYHFRLAVDGEEICLPAYFHQWAGTEYPEDKGIGRLRIGGREIGGDFVVSATENPQAPVLVFYETIDLSILPDNTNLYIRARKFRTNVWVDLESRKLSEIEQVPL
ncbi:MAG: hypothetical protein D3910_10555, partial [Candidatus Electrothrix sp. ATG2]|nr:hypothetical protein [Candidatus Electrothrix sp. ATG2]